MDLGDLELRGILARKSQLFLRLDCSRAWFRLRCSQINARANNRRHHARKYRAPNTASLDLANWFFWNCRGHDNFRSRIRARASLASDHRHLDDRIHSNYSHALRLLVDGRKNAADRGIVSGFVFSHRRSVAASFRAAHYGGTDASSCRRNDRIIALVWNSGANHWRGNHASHWCCRHNRSL